MLIPAARLGPTKATTPPTSSPAVVSVAAHPTSLRTTPSAAPRSTRVRRGMPAMRLASRSASRSRNLSVGSRPSARCARHVIAAAIGSLGSSYSRPPHIISSASPKSSPPRDESVWSTENGPKTPEQTPPPGANKLATLASNSPAIAKSVSKPNFFSSLLDYHKVLCNTGFGGENAMAVIKIVRLQDGTVVFQPSDPPGQPSEPLLVDRGEL